jgi:hypothetical protein
MTIARNASVNLITLGKLVAGIAISLAGLELKLLIAGNPDTIKDFSSQHVSRPKFLNFFQGGEVVTIGMAWRWPSNVAVWLSRGDPDAPLPQDTRPD